MIYNKLIQERKILYGLLFCMMSLFMTGCVETPVKIVLHAGLGRNEVFRIEQSSCYLPELLIYLATSRNKYENVYGETVWDVKLEGVKGVKFEVDTESIPAVFLDMLVKDIDIEIEEAKIITTKKEVKTDVAQPEEKPAEESGTVPCNGGR